MKRYIHIKKEDREFIAKAFKVSKRTVYNAIHFEDMNEGNDLTKKIYKPPIYAKNAPLRLFKTKRSGKFWCAKRLKALR